MMKKGWDDVWVLVVARYQIVGLEDRYKGEAKKVHSHNQVFESARSRKIHHYCQKRIYAQVVQPWT